MNYESINFEFSNVRYFRFNKQTFIESGKISNRFKLLTIQQISHARISSGKLYGEKIL